MVDGERVSSTRIRQTLQAGDLALAAQLLGRPYSITGICPTKPSLMALNQVSWYLVKSNMMSSLYDNHRIQNSEVCSLWSNTYPDSRESSNYICNLADSIAFLHSSYCHFP